LRSRLVPFVCLISFLMACGPADQGAASATETSLPATETVRVSTQTLLPPTATHAAPTETPLPPATSTPVPLPAQIRDDFGFPMVLVPAGPFVMGSEQGLGDAPPHTVTLDAYYIDQYEVTNAQFAAFLNELGNQDEGGTPWVDVSSTYGYLQQVDGAWQPDEGYADHPVVEVTWFGAKAFCAWRGARLPTEAEWEKAARGTDERTFPWGEEISCDYANYRACAINGSLPAGSHPDGVSPYGVHDMAGNVAEWTADWYAYDYYKDSPAANPRGPEESTGDHVASRGGSWYSSATYLRTFHRNHEFTSTSTLRNVGLRCARRP